MTTREENLKKINDELEKLDDEQLEKVAGGINMQLPMNVLDCKIPNTATDSNQPAIHMFPAIVT